MGHADHFNQWIGRRCEVEWVPSSRDLTQLDFFLWEKIKQNIYKTKIRDINQLKERIRRECSKIDADVELFHGVHQNFEKRINTCIDMDGNHIENTFSCFQCLKYVSLHFPRAA